MGLQALKACRGTTLLVEVVVQELPVMAYVTEAIAEHFGLPLDLVAASSHEDAHAAELLQMLADTAGMTELMAPFDSCWQRARPH